MMPPFPEDSAVCALAERLALTLQRRDAIEITDEAAIKAAGFLLSKPTPDYVRIAKALRDGESVPGARCTGVTYILRTINHKSS